MKVSLHNKEYTFLTGYQKDPTYRAAFDQLVSQVFGLSFEAWYQLGYWNEKYIPYTLFDGERAVANVSVNIMDFNVFGQHKRYIQLGTIATNENYRNRQLSRFLMEHVLQYWSQQCDLIYLFANSSVLNMYPKFGFEPVKEYEYSQSLEKTFNEQEKIEKLDMSAQKNRDLLYQYAKHSGAFSNLAMQENADLVMFYCTSFFKDNVFYIQSLDIIVVAQFNDNCLNLLDIFGKNNHIKIDTIIEKMAHNNIDKVTFGFTPKNCYDYHVKEAVSDETLFIQKDKTLLFQENKLMFPILSHA